MPIAWLVWRFYPWSTPPGRPSWEEFWGPDEDEER